MQDHISRILKGGSDYCEKNILNELIDGGKSSYQNMPNAQNIFL
jgi:hypothetical protein